MSEHTTHPAATTSHSVAPRFLLFPFGAAIGQVLLMAYGSDLSWPACIAAIATVSYFWFNVAGSFHETVHHTLFDSVRANVWLGRAIGTFTLIPYTAYKETHRLHHAYLNTPEDTELWPYGDPSWSKSSRRLFAWLDVFGSLIVTPLIYGRVAWMKTSRVKPEVRRTIRREYLGLAAFWLIVGAAAFWAVSRGHLRASVFHPLWLSPLWLSYTLNTLRKFTEHLGMGSLDQVRGTRTVIGPGLLTNIGSYFNFDIYVHGPHHRFPKARHYELPQKLHELQAASTEELPVFTTYRAAVLDMLPSLIRNPAVGLNVETQNETTVRWAA